jgi:hypothetical protein
MCLLTTATFTPPDRPPREAPQDKPQSAWNALRARASQPQKPPPEQKEKNIWGDDK